MRPGNLESKIQYEENVVNIPSEYLYLIPDSKIILFFRHNSATLDLPFTYAHLIPIAPPKAHGGSLSSPMWCLQLGPNFSPIAVSTTQAFSHQWSLEMKAKRTNEREPSMSLGWKSNCLWASLWTSVHSKYFWGFRTPEPLHSSSPSAETPVASIQHVLDLVSNWLNSHLTRPGSCQFLNQLTPDFLPCFKC